MELPDTADLVEDSIYALDEAALTDDAFQADVAALYEFQSQYASRPTFFRVMNTLERRGYFATIPIEDHPDYEDHPELFDELDVATISPIFRRPADEWAEETNPVVGYTADGTIYAEKGGEFWERLVDEGILEGDDAKRPPDQGLHGAVADVVESADEEGDLDLVLRWYAALGFHLAYHADDPDRDEEYLEELSDDPDLERVRAVVGEIEDLELKLAHPEHGVETPAPSLRDAHPILGWWYDLV